MSLLGIDAFHVTAMQVMEADYTVGPIDPKYVDGEHVRLVQAPLRGVQLLRVVGCPH